MIRGLLWKDYRLNRSLLVLGATVLGGVYLVGGAIELSQTWPAIPAPKACADALFSYGHLALALTPFLAALFGGNAIACERSDRSAHFLAYLPPAKWQILTSKLLVAAASTGVFWGVNLLVIYAVAPLINSEPTDFFVGTSGSLSAVIAGCVLTFGVGWFGSACFETAIYPAVLALGSPIVVGFGLHAIAAVSGLSRFEIVQWAGTASVCCGIAAFGAGTWCYLRRVEP